MKFDNLDDLTRCSDALAAYRNLKDVPAEQQARAAQQWVDDFGQDLVSDVSEYRAKLAAEKLAAAEDGA